MSSRRTDWSDHYTRKAQAAGYEARSVFKLRELFRRVPEMPRSGRVIDLGCHPGSWSRYLLQIGFTRLLGVDLKQPRDYPGSFILADVADLEPTFLVEYLGGRADLLVSDMAPNTTGNHMTDHFRQVELVRLAIQLAAATLRPGGAFVSKVFDGSEAPSIQETLRGSFTTVKRFRPRATRKHSSEFFLVAIDLS